MASSSMATSSAPNKTMETGNRYSLAYSQGLQLYEQELARSGAEALEDKAAALPPPMDLRLALDQEDAAVYYNKADYIQTNSGNKVSRKSVLCGSTNISLNGKCIVKPGVILRGDLHLLRLGKYCIIGDGTVLRPSTKKYKGNFGFFPMTIGDHVTIGARTICSAAHIGANVDIGEDCVISKRCIIKDNAMVISSTVLAPDTVVPPHTVFGGNPGRYLGDLPESMAKMQQQNAVNQYRKFLPLAKGQTLPD